MMTMIEGQERVLALVTSRELLLKLFTNDVMPQPGDQAKRYVEPRYGYTHKLLSPSNWKVVGRSLEYPEQSYSFSSAIGDVYGAFLVFKTTGELLGVERFGDYPVNIATVNHKLVLSVHLD